jgi:hypothetical protein
MGNPMQQDEKYGWPRYLTMGVSPFNYGMIPQTWESKFKQNNLTGTYSNLYNKYVSASTSQLGRK